MEERLSTRSSYAFTLLAVCNENIVRVHAAPAGLKRPCLLFGLRKDHCELT